MEKIRVGIAGYGNVGKGVELAVSCAPDMELIAVFTRRPPQSVRINTPGAEVAHMDDVELYQGRIDVMILCGGSHSDLPVQGPKLAALFNTVDSFDTHAKIPEYFAALDSAARNTVAILSVGWDPGLFSMHRLLGASILPQGTTQTFWGKGVSQGHSDALRRVEGVENAIQYTVPIEEAVNAARQGEGNGLTPRQKHLRECYVVAKPGADKEEIVRRIQTMPNYFADYDTTVHFISSEELQREHGKMPHGGFVVHSGQTDGHSQALEFSLKLESNPEFTAAVLVSYARAAARMFQHGATGAKTVFDVPLSCLSTLSPEEQIALYL